MALKISPGVKHKLSFKHSVGVHEIFECFANRCGGFLEDKREDNRTTPPTVWFVAETDYGRKLKVACIIDKEAGDIILKTAYPANAEEIRIYSKYGKNS